jgi:hypothetical protein
MKVLKPHAEAMRSYAATHPMPEPQARRVLPTKTWIWRRYVTSMITVQTLSTARLWSGLGGDPRWHALRRGGPERCPSRGGIATLLRVHGVRFPEQKAARICRAAAEGRDFEGLAKDVRKTLTLVHDARLYRDRRRREEVRLAVAMQDALAGCGVAPKVARLALLGLQELTQIIPIDSRWMNALRDAGYVLTPADLTREDVYREVEDELVEAAWDLGCRPSDCDGVPFGWLFGEGV